MGQSGNRLILLDFNASVAVVTLNRPERHNSLVPALLEELLAALKKIETRAEMGAVVLQANGRSFSTGGDLRGFYEHFDALDAYARRIVGLLNQVVLALIGLPVPVVAAVHGIVTGGSLGFVLGSDIVLVAPEASFTPYYSVVGFSPDGGWTAVLPGIIGPKRAAETLLQNLTITSDQAVAWGLANRVVPAQQIREQALTKAREIAAKKPGSVWHTKRLLHLSHGEIERRLEAERSHFVQQITTDEARQGIVTFLKQRGRSTTG